MWRNTEVSRRLQLQAPIVQGPFGSGLSSVALTRAVSEAGGLGSFGVHHLHGDAILHTAAAIRAVTAKPFALNLWLPHPSEQRELDDAQFDSTLALFQPYFEELGLPLPARPAETWPNYAEQIEALLEARPAVFSFVYGVPSAEVLEQCRARGILTLGAATTVEEARALEAAGVDMLVASGCEAGGHRVAFLRPAEESLIGSLALIPQMVDAVRIPVIAAGGIADGRGIAAALCLGAQGVQIGTAFLACRESGASERHRQALFSPLAGHTALTRAFSGRLARGMRNRLLEELAEHQAALPGYPAQGWFAGALKQAALTQQRDDLLALWCGQAAPLLRQRSALELWNSLLEQTDRLLPGR
ncbi:NAD(P)H-dependent flavin oxidoreductase [Pseudomonas borbori]